MPPCEEEVGRLVSEILERQLVTPYEREKTPYGLNKALESTESVEQASSAKDRTEKILLHSGFQVWFAHYIARLSNNRKRELETFSLFYSLPEDSQKKLAAEIAKVQAHETVANAMQDIMAKRPREYCIIVAGPSLLI